MLSQWAGGPETSGSGPVLRATTVQCVGTSPVWGFGPCAENSSECLSLNSALMLPFFIFRENRTRLGHPPSGGGGFLCCASYPTVLFASLETDAVQSWRMLSEALWGWVSPGPAHPAWHLAQPEAYIGLPACRPEGRGRCALLPRVPWCWGRVLRLLPLGLGGRLSGSRSFAV